MVLLMSDVDFLVYYLSVFFFSSRRRHTRCALVTGVQTCALPISLAKSLSPVRSKDVHPAVINSPQWSVKGLFAIVSYTGPMPQTREIIFEFHRVGGYVKVSAVDTLTSAEVSIVGPPSAGRSEEHTSELQSLMRISYAVFCLKKKQQ